MRQLLDMGTSKGVPFYKVSMKEKQLTLDDAIENEKIHLEEMPLGWTWTDDKNRKWVWTEKGWIKSE